MNTKPIKPPRPLVSQTEVLAWLHQNYSELHARARIDRAWVWLKADLQGEQNKPIREELKQFGFVFAFQKKEWAHHCNAPIPFYKKGKGGGGKRGYAANDAANVEQRNADASIDREIESLLAQLA